MMLWPNLLKNSLLTSFDMGLPKKGEGKEGPAFVDQLSLLMICEVSPFCTVLFH